MKRALSVLLSLLLICFGAACGDAQESWQEQYDLGLRYLSDGNYREAILAFEAAIEIDNKQPEVYLSLAQVYAEQGDPEKALEVLQAAWAIQEDEQIALAMEEYRRQIERLSVILPDGEYTARMSRDGFTQTQQGLLADLDILEPIRFTDAYVSALQLGDYLDVMQFGYSENIPVTSLTFREEILEVSREQQIYLIKGNAETIDWAGTFQYDNQEDIYWYMIGPSMGSFYYVTQQVQLPIPSQTVVEDWYHWINMYGQEGNVTALEDVRTYFEMEPYEQSKLIEITVTDSVVTFLKISYEP